MILFKEVDVKKLVILAIIAMVVLQAAAFAVKLEEKPGVLGKGAWDLEADLQYYLYGAYINAAGTSTTMPGGYSFTELSIPLAAYYGLGNNWQLGIALPYRNLSYTPGTGIAAITGSGLGDTTLSGKYQLNNMAAVELDVKLGTGQHTGGNAIQDILGTGSSDIGLKAVLGNAMWNGMWYGTIGYTVTGDDTNKSNMGDYWTLNAACDYGINKTLNFTGGLYSNWGCDGKTLNVASAGITAAALKIGLENQFNPNLLGRASVAMGIYGKNTYAATVIQAGLVYNL
ncbi:MAG: hypothetical protein NT099_07250 [Candidatus Saganbacteria bacterium]|nr:hypothetical protein [Candidatus Saganbacteria bacterium]